MDIFTHAVAIMIILFATGNTAFIPFGVLGAVIIDIDMAYSFIARRNPSLFLLFHGGINHSIIGSTIISVIAFGVTLVLSYAGLLPGPLQGALIIPAIASVLAGAYLHLFLDYLAAPGLPLLYPLTEKRFGLSLFPMPLYFLITVLSLASLGGIFVWGLTPEIAELYGVIFTGIIVISLGMKWFVYHKARGKSYQTFHFFQWIVIQEENTSYSVVVYDLFRGVIRELIFEKYRNITPSDARRYDRLPEIQRHKYFSYISTVEKNGSEITFRDPVREGGLISYPPWYPSVTVSTIETAS
jgi:inner membrane protein